MPPFIVVLGTQVLNIKVRSSKFIMKCIAQKVMALDIGHKFHDLNILKVDLFLRVTWFHHKDEGIIANINLG